MYKLKTQVEFECAHRLYNVDTYSEECRKNIHGHSYKATVVVSRNSLNSAGMVIDFKLLKKIINEKIVDKYDHAIVLREADPVLDIINSNCDKVVHVPESPTAEWMAEIFYTGLEEAIKEIDSEIAIVYVAVQETSHNIAIYER